MGAYTCLQGHNDLLSGASSLQEGDSVLTIAPQHAALTSYSKQGSNASATSNQSFAPSVELIPRGWPSPSKQNKPRLPAVDHHASTKKLTGADMAEGDKTPPCATLSPEHSVPSQASVEATDSQRSSTADDVPAVQRGTSESQKVVLEELGISASLVPAGDGASHEDPNESVAKVAECSPEEMRDDERSQGSSASAAHEGDEAHAVATDAALDDTAYEPAVSKLPLVPDTVADKGDAGSVPSQAAGSDGSAGAHPGGTNNLVSISRGESNSSKSEQSADTGSSSDHLADGKGASGE